MATSRRIRDEVAADASPVPSGDGERDIAGAVGSGYSGVPNVEAEDRNHEDVAQFRGVMSAVGALREIAEGRRGGRHGRRWALISTKLEEVYLQARQGVHEATYGQGE